MFKIMKKFLRVLIIIVIVLMVTLTSIILLIVYNKVPSVDVYDESKKNCVSYADYQEKEIRKVRIEMNPAFQNDGIIECSKISKNSIESKIYKKSELFKIYNNGKLIERKDKEGNVFPKDSIYNIILNEPKGIKYCEDIFKLDLMNMKSIDRNDLLSIIVFGMEPMTIDGNVIVVFATDGRCSNKFSLIVREKYNNNNYNKIQNGFIEIFSNEK